MNAILCDVETKSEMVVFSELAVFARMGGSAPRQGRCPHCDSIIYSRRHKLCGVCSNELPETCRFDQTQAANVALLLQEERTRHRAWMMRYASSN